MAVDYQIHLPDYIAKCINKDKPQLHCDGQCVLMKKIREKEEEETKKNLVAYEYSTHYVHKERIIFTVHKTNDEVGDKTFPPYLVDYKFTYHTPIFRPPIA